MATSAAETNVPTGCGEVPPGSLLGNNPLPDCSSGRVPLSQPLTQGLVHRGEAGVRALQETAREGDEAASEGFALGQLGAVVGQWLEGEGVRPVEQAGQEEVAEPRQVLCRVDVGDRGTEGHRLAARGGGA